jgi:hypothetical protein
VDEAVAKLVRRRIAECNQDAACLPLGTKPRQSRSALFTSPEQVKYPPFCIYRDEYRLQGFGSTD